LKKARTTYRRYGKIEVNVKVCVRQAPVRVAPPSWSRHPQTFTGAEIAPRRGSGRLKRFDQASPVGTIAAV
jgi:hypothetical protein